MSERKKRKRKGERPNGLIQVSLTIGRNPNGTPMRKYFYGKTRKEAEQKRDAYKTQPAGAIRRIGTTVREWTEEYMQTYRTRINPAYIHSDNVPYNRLISEIGHMKMVDVDEVTLQKSVNQMAGMSFSSVNKYCQAIKRVFSKAKKNKIIQDDPSEDLELPHYTKGTHRALEKWEVDLILGNWNMPSTSAGMWIMLMLLCGLRRGEMMALRWENIDMDARLLTVCEAAVIDANKAHIEQRAKTDAGIRTIPICQPLYDALNSVPLERRHGLVCSSPKGELLTKCSIQYGLNTFCKSIAQISGRDFSFRAHDLRHTFCTFLYDAGVDAKAAAYFMGHSNVQMMMEIYTHLSSAHKEQSCQSIVRFLDSFTPLKTL